jgi:hypothetical protein
MRRKRIDIKATIAALACGALALPASALASPTDVGEHIARADQALAKVETLVAHNQDALAAIAMARANVQARLAGVDAADVRGASGAATAWRRVARQFSENAEAFAGLIDEVRGSRQDDVADAVRAAVNGRARAVEELTALLERVPAEAVPGLTRAIAAISGDGDAVASLEGALAAGGIAPGAIDDVEAALARARAALEDVLDRLEALVSELPAEAQPYVEAAIDRVREHLSFVFDLLDGLLGGGFLGGGFGPRA